MRWGDRPRLPHRMASLALGRALAAAVPVRRARAARAGLTCAAAQAVGLPRPAWAGVAGRRLVGHAVRPLPYLRSPPVSHTLAGRHCTPAYGPAHVRVGCDRWASGRARVSFKVARSSAATMERSSLRSTTMSRMAQSRSPFGHQGSQFRQTAVRILGLGDQSTQSGEIWFAVARRLWALAVGREGSDPFLTGRVRGRAAVKAKLCLPEGRLRCDRCGPGSGRARNAAIHLEHLAEAVQPAGRRMAPRDDKRAPGPHKAPTGR